MLQVDLHGMNVEEAIEKLEKHVASLSGLSSATFVLQVSLFLLPTSNLFFCLCTLTSTYKYPGNILTSVPRKGTCLRVQKNAVLYYMLTWLSGIFVGDFEDHTDRLS